MELMTNVHFKKVMKYIQTIGFFFSCFVIILFFLITGSFFVAKIIGPPPVTIPQSTIYYAENGTVIGETHDGQKRYWVDLEDISPHLISATIAIEDQRFYSHIGFDPKRIAGAVFADVKAMAKVQGASTISQQYARNLFLTHEKTWKRKIKEAIYTIRLEANYSKKDILEGYLNTIYYGHGMYGIEAASRFYFDKNASDLNVSEAALLASIPKGPNSFSPFISWEKAKSRQKLILSAMAEQGSITKKDVELFANAPLDLKGVNKVYEENIAPYFQDVVRMQLKHTVGLDDRIIALGGLRVYTTIDPNMQKIAEDTFEDIIKSNSIQAAFIAMDPSNGHVRALIGGRDYKKSSYNRAVQALRHPGSTLKPILYYAAIEKGFTPSTTLRSELTTFTFDDGREEYTPTNFNYKYAEDEIPLAQALALSDNVYAVKTHLYLGMDTLIDYAKKFGIHSKLEKVPALALGSSGVRLIEMANAYAHFANGGMSVEPTFITKVVDRNGEVIYEHTARQERILDPDATFVMNHMMTGIFDEKLNGYATVTGHQVIPKITREYAGKSGSTNTDSWMIGYTPKLVAAVWAGYDKGVKITRTDEKQYAKNIWAEFMEKALKDEPAETFKPTKGVIGVHVDPSNGLLATEDCPVDRYTYFVKGTEPTDYCMDHGLDSVPDMDEEIKDKPWYKRWLDWIS